MKRIGLVVLASDMTIEREWRAMVPPNVDFLVARITYANSCTTESLREMAAGIESTAALILPGISLDAVGYACTSATVAIGAHGVADSIGKAHPGVGVATPITAATEALKYLKVSKIAVLAPYLQDTSENVFQYFRDDGFEVVNSTALGIESDYDIAGVDEKTIMDACEKLDSPETEAIFLSCTALTAAHLIDKLERRHGKPVLCSNQCLLWQSLRIAGAPTNTVNGFGKIFAS